MHRKRQGHIKRDLFSSTEPSNCLMRESAYISSVILFRLMLLHVRHTSKWKPLDEISYFISSVWEWNKWDIEMNRKRNQRSQQFYGLIHHISTFLLLAHSQLLCSCILLMQFNYMTNTNSDTSFVTEKLTYTFFLYRSIIWIQSFLVPLIHLFFLLFDLQHLLSP